MGSCKFDNICNSASEPESVWTDLHYGMNALSNDFVEFSYSFRYNSGGLTLIPTPVVLGGIGVPILFLVGNDDYTYRASDAQLTADAIGVWMAEVPYKQAGLGREWHSTTTAYFG